MRAVELGLPVRLAAARQAAQPLQRAQRMGGGGPVAHTRCGCSADGRPASYVGAGGGGPRHVAGHRHGCVCLRSGRASKLLFVSGRALLADPPPKGWRFCYTQDEGTGIHAVLHEAVVFVRVTSLSQVTLGTGPSLSNYVFFWYSNPNVRFYFFLFHGVVVPWGVPKFVIGLGFWGFSSFSMD